MQTVKFNAGDTILSEGEAGDTAFLIVAGSVEVSIGEGAKAKSVGTLDAGEVFGEMSLIEPGPRSATVKAVTDTECLRDHLRRVHRLRPGRSGTRGRVHEDAGPPAAADERADRQDRIREWATASSSACR